MKKLMVPSNESLRFVVQADIVYCKSDNCYTSIHLNNGEELLVCKSLKKISQELDRLLFVRVNQSYLINRDCIKLIDKKSKFIELINSQRIPFTVTISELLSLIAANLV